MKARIDTGTDIAMLGAWDASRNASPLKKLWGKEYDSNLKSDADAGHLFFIATGADCGGPIDVLVQEDIEPEIRKEMTLLPGEFLLCVPSGTLVVGGVEDYRSTRPRITGDSSLMRIPAGNYLVKAHRGPEENIPVTPTKEELKELLGEEDFQYHQRSIRNGCLGYLTLLLWPILWPLIGWKLATGVAVVVVVGWFLIRERIFLRYDERYQRINKLVNDAYQKADAQGPPIFLLELRPLENSAGKQGGSIDLHSSS